MPTQWVRIQERTTGLWYWMIAHSKRVYSFDGGKSWHKTRSAAFEGALSDPREATAPETLPPLGKQPCDDPACPGSRWRTT